MWKKNQTFTPKTLFNFTQTHLNCETGFKSQKLLKSFHFVSYLFAQISAKHECEEWRKTKVKTKKILSWIWICQEISHFKTQCCHSSQTKWMCMLTYQKFSDLPLQSGLLRGKESFLSGLSWRTTGIFKKSVLFERGEVCYSLVFVPLSFVFHACLTLLWRVCTLHFRAFLFPCVERGFLRKKWKEKGSVKFNSNFISCLIFK